MKYAMLDSINFDRYDDRYAQPGRCLKGTFVPKREFDLMWQKVTASLPTLMPGKRYTSKQIFADSLWNDFPTGRRIALGRVLSYFVEQGMLPLRLVNPNKRGPRRYVLTNSSVICNVLTQRGQSATAHEFKNFTQFS